MKIFKRGSTSDFSEYESCIIVGNSSRICGSNFGQYIDDFDLIVRLNNAPIEGYQSDVGSRTDIRVVNTVIQKGMTLSGCNLRRDYLENIENKKVILYPSKKSVEEKVKNRIQLSSNDLEYYFLSEEFKEYIHELEEYIGIDKISTGLFSIVLFIHIFGGLSIINFDFYNFDSSDTSHYWENFDGGDTSLHSFGKEKEFFFEELEGDVVNFIQCT